jgi:hypothetical protein
MIFLALGVLYAVIRRSLFILYPPCSATVCLTLS